MTLCISIYSVVSMHQIIIYYIFYKTGFSFSQQEGQQTNINRIGNSRATEKEYDLLKTKVNGYCNITKVYCKQGQSEKNKTSNKEYITHV